MDINGNTCLISVALFYVVDRKFLSDVNRFDVMLMGRDNLSGFITLT